VHLSVWGQARTLVEVATHRKEMPAEAVITPATGSPCTSCGACCAYSYDWPEFSDDDDLDGIPEELCDCDVGRMKCNGDRCVALQGQIGQAVRCVVYESRPGVCRSFKPGTSNCNTVRRFFGLSDLPVADLAPVR
jgi:Fe-S-cluster containining protein